MQPIPKPSPQATQAHRGGFIFYPRRYELAPNPLDSYADGVDVNGRSCRVFLQPPEHFIEAARKNPSRSIPRFEEFAQTDRRAKNPCIASTDNSQQKHAGVLLIEQAYVRNSQQREFGGKWASVLCPDDRAPAPQFGMGYLEIVRNPSLSEEARAIAVERKRLLDDLTSGRCVDRFETEDRLAKTYFELLAAIKHYFVCVILQCDSIITLKKRTAVELFAAIEPHLVEMTRDGMYAGAIVRVRKGGLVLRSHCASLDMKYDYKRKVPLTAHEVWKEFNRFECSKVFSALRRDPDIEIEVIPTRRINCGKSTNEKYASELLRRSGDYSKLINTYVEKPYRVDPLHPLKRSFGFLASKFAVRMHDIWSGPDAGNLIASACHAYSPSIGNALSIDCNMRATYDVTP